MGRCGVPIRGSHSSSRCAMLIVIVIMSAQAVGRAGQPVNTVPNCFGRLEKELPSKEPIILYTTDSVMIRGINPIASRLSSALYVTVLSDLGLTTGLMIPFDKIDSVAFRKPTGGAFTVLGLVAGAWAGATIGTAMANKERMKSGKNVDGISYGFAGALLGGLIGAGAFSEIGSNFKVTVTLRCK